MTELERQSKRYDQLLRAWKVYIEKWKQLQAENKKLREWWNKYRICLKCGTMIPQQIHEELHKCSSN